MCKYLKKFLSKVEKLLDKINDERWVCVDKKREFEKELMKLPESQQVPVRACFDAAGKAPSQRRFAME